MQFTIENWQRWQQKRLLEKHVYNLNPLLYSIYMRGQAYPSIHSVKGENTMLALSYLRYRGWSWRLLVTLSFQTATQIILGYTGCHEVGRCGTRDDSQGTLIKDTSHRWEQGTLTFYSWFWNLGMTSRANINLGVSAPRNDTSFWKIIVGLSLPCISEFVTIFTKFRSKNVEHLTVYTRVQHLFGACPRILSFKSPSGMSFPNSINSAH